MSSLIAQVDYATQIQPIFDNNCISCHVDGGAYFGELDLSSYAEVIEGGSSGNTIVPYEHSNSELYQRITLSESNNQFMPQNGSPLSQFEIDLIAQWIDEGALETPLIQWNFSIGEPEIEIFGDDDQWNPGETILIDMEFCNNTGTSHGWYPGVVLESDSNLITIFNDHYWFYGMESDTCNMVQFSVIADTSIVSDTIITFSAYPESLNCQNYPEYCIEGDTIIFEVLLVLDYTSNDKIIFVPKKFIIHQNYPNPFNPITTLKYELLKDTYVDIIIYDMLGNVVSNLVNTNQSSGYKSIQWNATNNYGKKVAAGVYFYSIEAGGFRQAKKMVLLK